MDRHWLLTNTCYGNWLPGDHRGFIGHVRDHRPEDPPQHARITHNQIDTPYDADLPGLKQMAHSLLRGEPIRLTVCQAQALLNQFQETATHRGWQLRAVAIMFNHFHIVVGVRGDPPPAKILGDFKSWATRTLSERFGPPISGTWWTERGSKRKLSNATAVARAVHYVLFDQPQPLVTWSPETGLHLGPPPR
jgi:REP element-mobilizing transposase RayT